MTNLHDLSTYWHETYIEAARDNYPDVTEGHVLAVGWKVTTPTGASYGGYYWPLVNAEHDVPVLHEATAWDSKNQGSCPNRPGDGLCLVTDDGISQATSGVVASLGSCTGHVLVYATDLARGSETGKHRVPWVIDVDCFDAAKIISAGLVANLYNANLRNANLYNADLRYADLGNANLRNANLYNANLRYADLGNADLRSADLRYADLGNADLGNADLRNADLGYARSDRYTQWPSGFGVPATVVIL